MSERPSGTVTFLFTDIEGSTTRWEHHPEAMRAALARHDALLRSIITASNGFVFKMVGDAVYAAFADAADAIAAAVAGQRAVAAEAWGEVSPLRVRMALHTGAAQNREDDYFGPTLNRVARVLSTGYGDQILLSVATVELIRDALPAGASLKDLGEHALKDLLRPEHIFQLSIPDVPSDFPALKSLTHQPHNLPVQPTPFLGREQEVASVCKMLSRPEARLLTLTGPGGIGKTRLGLHAAAELADQFTDGVWFVALAPLSDAELVVPTIMQTLSISETGGHPLLGLLKAALKDKHLLLLLDNFEQVVQAAPVVAELLTACPKLTVLVTSRVVLRVRAEREFSVPALSLPDLTRLPDLGTLSQYEAVALFIERAQTVKADFAVTNANAPAVAAICARLDGLPLAIELAAARSKLLSPQALLARLSQRLVVLTSGARDVPARHQTLRNTIAWSYDLLEEDEKTLFRRLSVFVGGCTLEATEAICNANRDLEEDVLDAVARLVDKSLLRQEAEIDGEPRLLMLETIREYALDRLAASGEAEVVRRQHATFYLRLSEEAEPQIRSSKQSTWRRRLEIEHDNLRAALSWMLENQEVEMGLRLAGALLAFWRASNQENEGRSWLEQVLVQPNAKARTAARAKALLAAGAMTMFQGDLPEAHRLFAESISIGREVGVAGKRNLAHALTGLGHATLLQGDPTTARELAEEGLRLFKEVGEAWGTAFAQFYLGKATVELGDLVAARSLLEESAALFRVVGDRQRLASPLNVLGLVALRQGDYAGASAHFEEALAVARETEDEKSIAEALAHLGTVALRVGDYPQSAALYQQSLALIWARGYTENIAEDLAGLAAVASLLSQPDRAARLFGAVEALREVSGISLPPLRRAEYDRAVEGIRAHLDEATFAQAWAQGRAMPPEQVIVEVLKMGDKAGKQ